MFKLLAALALVLVQSQPLTSLLQCEQHRETTAEMPMPSGEHEHPSPAHHPGQLPSDCPSMGTCAVTAPAPVPVIVRTVDLLPVASQRYIRRPEHPAAVFSPPPFHPPSA